MALTILQDSLDNSDIDHDYVPSMCEGDSDLDGDIGSNVSTSDLYH